MSGRLLFLLLSCPGVLGGCLYTPDADGHVTVPDGVEQLGLEEPCALTEEPSCFDKRCLGS